jgi:hypothetical protein
MIGDPGYDPPDWAHHRYPAQCVWCAAIERRGKIKHSEDCVVSRKK